MGVFALGSRTNAKIATMKESVSLVQFPAHRRERRAKARCMSASRVRVASEEFMAIMNTTRRVFRIFTSPVLSISMATLVSGFPANGGAQKRPPRGSYWVGNLEIRTRASRLRSDIVLSYRVYQNPTGIARLELISSPPLTVIGPGRDVHIIDFNTGTLVALDKARAKAVRSKRSDFDRGRFPAESVPLGRKTILGYECTGVEVTSRDPKTNITEIRWAWVATGIDFREPLVETIKSLDSREEPISITEKVITHLRSAQHLDSSLFRIPHGYKITDTAEH